MAADAPVIGAESYADFLAGLASEPEDPFDDDDEDDESDDFDEESDDFDDDSDELDDEDEEESEPFDDSAFVLCRFPPFFAAARESVL
jgi:hypothetical protein